MKKILFFLVIPLLLIACDKNTVGDQTNTDLIGFWRYQSGVPFNLVNPLDGENPVAYIDLEESGRITGNTSKNLFEGNYTHDETGLFDVEVVSSTLGPDTEWSGHFDSMIRSADQYAISGNQLTLSRPDAQNEYTFIKLNDGVCMPASNDRDRFQNNLSDDFRLIEVNVFETCLEARIEYSGGCEGIDVELIGSGDYAESLPPQLSVRFIVVDNDPCEALVHENFYFDLTDLRYDGVQELLLNIEGLSEPVLVRY